MWRFTQVKHALPDSEFKEDNWCWEKSFLLVDVGAEDVHGVEFVQEGYKVIIKSSHVVDAKMIQSNGSSVDLQIKVAIEPFYLRYLHCLTVLKSYFFLQKGSQQICLKNPGVHELYFVDSCVFFGSSLVKIDTLNPTTVSHHCLSLSFWI